MDLSAISEVLKQYPPASAEQLAQLVVEVGPLPGAYLELLSQANGIQADTFLLYPADSVKERNGTYEVATYLPGYLTIGDDGGGRAILIRSGSGLSPVFLVGHGSMSPAFLVQVAGSIEEWVRQGCSLGDEDD